jgi:uncharacterized protein YdeI (BOF family)
MNRKAVVPMAMLILAWSLVCSVGKAGPVTLEEAEGREVRFQGQVIVSIYNEAFLLKYDSSYIMVRIGKEHWALGIAPGDQVLVVGKLTRKNVVRDVVVAADIKKTGSAPLKEPGTRLQSIRSAKNEQIKNRLVAVRGRITQITPRNLTIKDADDSIAVNLAPDDNRTYFFAGMDAVVVGTLRTSPYGNTIEPVALIPAVLFRREGEPDKAQSISAILKARPMGKLVKARGRIALFLGREDTTMIYEEKDILIVRRSEKYIALDAEAGRLVNVVGTFDVEEHRGREYGVLREARIDPPDVKVTKPLKE